MDFDQAWDEQKQRLSQAIETLKGLELVAFNECRHFDNDRLRHKREGVELSLGYMKDYERRMQ